MKPPRATHFVEDGPQRFLQCAEVRKKRAEIAAEVRAEYGVELMIGRSFWARVALEIRIRREIRRRVRAFLPSPFSVWVSHQ
jgi:hypothetical protein